MSFVTTESHLKRLEKQLKTQKNDQSRLLLIEELVEHYTYSDIQRAQKLLDEFIKIVEKERKPNRDYLLSYHLFSALVENQFYNYRLSVSHYKQAIEILEERGDVRQQAEAYIDYAGVCINEEEIEEATRLLDRKVWIYDENSYPSGFAG